MLNPQGALIHGFLTKHPVGRAIAQHTRYGPGHPVHDAHAQAEVAGAPGMQAVSPTLMRTAHGPLNPALMRQLMAMHAGAGGTGAPPLPLPQGPAPAMPQQMPGPGMPGPAMPPPSMPPGMPGR